MSKTRLYKTSVTRLTQAKDIKETYFLQCLDKSSAQTEENKKNRSWEWLQREQVRIGYDGDGSNNQRLAKRKRGPYKGASTAMIYLKVAMRCRDTLLFRCQRMHEHRGNSLITSFDHRTSVPLQFASLNRSGSDDFLLASSSAHRLMKQKAS